MRGLDLHPFPPSISPSHLFLHLPPFQNEDLIIFNY